MAIDLRDFSINGGPPKRRKPSASSAQRRWWLAGNSNSEVAEGISSTLQFIYEHQYERRAQANLSAKLYGNLPLLGQQSGLGLAAGSQAVQRQSGPPQRLTYNVCQSAVDTVSNKIAKNKPKPYFLTSGGDYRQQRKAKKLTQFCDGVFYETKYHPTSVKVFRDACVFGAGVLLVLQRNERVALERVHWLEIYFDDLEAFYGDPRQLHRVKSVDRDVLKDMCPGHDSDIDSAKSTSLEDPVPYPTTADMVTLRESWHLPSGPEATDGAHVLTVGDRVLLREKMTREHFPFAVFRWSDRLFGMQGQGLIEQIQNIQLEINKTLAVIQKSMHLAGSFKILMEQGSKIVTEHLNNAVGTVIKYTGTPPQYVVPPILSPETYQHLITLKNAAFEQAGISQLSAQSKKPEGLDSGKALREFNDIESDRFTLTGQAFEQLAVDVACLVLETVDDITDGGKKKYEVRSPGKKDVSKLDFRDVSLPSDSYVTKCFPVSGLTGDPSDRLQTVQEYAQAGFLTPRQARRLMDFPDLEAEGNLSTAAEEVLEQNFGRLLDDEEFEPPEPYDDLQMAREMAQEYYHWGRVNGLEEEKLESLRRYMAQVDELVASAAPPPPPAMPGAAPGAPQAAPMAPPQSDLLPNAPSQAA